MRPFATSGGVLVLCLAALTARAGEVRYSFPGREPAHATVDGHRAHYQGFRLLPGRTLEATVQGPGVLRLLYFQDYTRGRPLPGTVRVMVTLDRDERMSALSPRRGRGLSYRPHRRDRARPSGPLPVLLKIGRGSHPLAVRLVPGTKLGGTLFFGNASRMGDDLDLGLGPLASNAPPPKGGDDLALTDLDLAPAGPAKGARKPPADLDLDLGLGPAPAAKSPPKKPAADDLDLDLDLPGPAPKAAQVAAPKPPPGPSTQSLLAEQPEAPAEPPSSTFLAVEPSSPSPRPRHRRHRRRPLAVVAPPSPPPRLGAMELGARAGWALGRGDLRGGQGLYLLELGYRLTAQGHPNLRVVFAAGYTLISGQWTDIEPGRGLGGFSQNTTLVPMELGLTWEPWGPGGASPYLGLAFSSGLANTSLQRFSLPAAQAVGPAAGVTGELGLRLQAGRGSFVFELRHTESTAGLQTLASLGQSTLSASALTGGYLYSF